MPFFLLSCLEPYYPPTITNEIDILVVDGFLNNTDGTASIKLSNANELSNPNEPLAEINAEVSITSEDGSLYHLIEQDSGHYFIDGLNVSSNTRYRLNIKTFNGSEYRSDYIELKQAPLLNLTWQAATDGVNILINTFDPTGKTLYYRWDYSEAWQYRAIYESVYKLVNGKVIDLEEDDKVYNCWTSTQSTNILIGSTLRLSEDIISNYSIMFLPRGTKKLAVRYSILVRQAALSKQEYDFWQQLKKTTESLGSLFDPQPSQVLGNIYNVNESGVPVLGYFSGGAVQEKRIFIDFYDLPDPLRFFDPRTLCTYDTILASDVAGLFVYERLINNITIPGGIPAYTKTVTECADCREQGGTTSKPTFW